MSAPIPRITWPILIASEVNNHFALTVGSNTYTLTVPAGSYASPEALLTELNTLATTAAGDPSGGTLTGGGQSCVFSLTADGFVQIAFSGYPSASYGYSWAQIGGGPSLGKTLGFTGTFVDFTGTMPFTATAPYQISSFWTPGLPVRSDSRDTSTFARGMVATPTDTAGQSAVFAVDLAQQDRRQIQFENVPDNRVFVANEGSVLNTAIERLWQPATGGYSSFRYYPDRDEDDFATYSLAEETAQTFEPERLYDALPLYKFTLKMLRVADGS